MKNLTISAYYAKAIVHGAPRRGVDINTLLRKSGISPEQLIQPEARIHTEQFITLYQNAWRDMDDELLGRTSSRSKVGSFHLIGTSIIHSNNLRAAIQQWIRGYRILSEDLNISLEENKEQVEIIMTHRKPELDPDNFLVEWLLVVLHRFSGWLVGKRIVLTHAFFQQPLPSHADEYRYSFPCQSSFDHTRNSIVFNKEYLDLPIVRSTKELKKFIESSPRDILIWAKSDNSLATKVRTLLDSYESDSLPNLDWVADHLNTTPYTLSRKLKAEGIPFQKIKDNYRRDKAITMLSQQSISVCEISEKLGFTEPSAFSRAFKKWTSLALP